MSVTTYSLTKGVPEAYATNPSGTFGFDSTASVNMDTSWQLQDNSWPGSVSNSTSVKAGRNTQGTFQFDPGTTNNSTSEDPTAGADGNGWIYDAGLGGSAGSIATGNWTFRICLDITNTDGDQAGYMRFLAYRVGLTGTAPNKTINSSTLLFDTTTNFSGTDVLATDGADQQFSFVESSVAAKTFSEAEDTLYVEAWLVVNADGDANDNATFLVGNTSCTDDPAVLTPAVTIPENVIYLVALAPFVPFMVGWLKRRKIKLCSMRVL